jgi:hypothetical protein
MLQVSTSRDSDAEALIGTIRRAIRVLGAQPAHVTLPEATQMAAKLVHGRLVRAGVSVRWFEGTSGTPLLIAGSGPIVFCTYLDDSRPDATNHDGQPPSVDAGIIRGPGIERKAGVLAVVAMLLDNPSLASRITVLVETDRHSGSRTIAQWIANERPALSAAAWEVSDLPVNAPVIVRSATGTLVLEIRLIADRRRVETVYGTVLPDLGIELANLLATLKTTDSEVRLEGFYDAIGSPGETDLEAVVQLAPGVSRWLATVASSERDLSTAHMTLGMFCAPSMIVRSVHLNNDEDYLPETASAIVEFQLLPGQSIDTVISAISDHSQKTPFRADVTSLLTRPPVAATPTIELLPDLPVIPITPGPSPASIFDQASIPAIGYAVVSRDPERASTGLSIDSIVEGTGFLVSLADMLSEQTTAQ